MRDNKKEQGRTERRSIKSREKIEDKSGGETDLSFLYFVFRNIRWTVRGILMIGDLYFINFFFAYRYLFRNEEERWIISIIFFNLKKDTRTM